MKGSKMAKFHDTLDQFGVAVALPDEFKAAILAAYDEDVAAVSTNVDAKVTALTTQITDRDTKISDLEKKYTNETVTLKAALFDTLRAAPITGSATSTSGDNDSGENNEDVDIDDLFGTPTK